jgi:DNA (cytosine-5)-methyltransferase 1
MRPSALDLFAGCGGLSLGLAQAGFRVVGAVEKDNWAAESYLYNHPETQLMMADSREISEAFLRANYSGVELVAGGPPCQGFSVAGKRQLGQFIEQNTLVEEFLRIALLLRPRLILIENVQGFRTAQIRQGVKAVDFVTEALASAGYNFRSAILNAQDFGVPSIRSRFFLVASRDRLLPTFARMLQSVQQKQKPVSTWDAISDLPEIDAGGGDDGCQPYATLPGNEFQQEMRVGSRGVWNHRAMNHTPRLVERFRSIKMGDSGYRIGRQNVGQETVTVYKSNNQRLHADRPALCITANFQSNYIHPFRDRNLTAREAARLMTFPDTYVFKGKRTQMSSSFLHKYGRAHENFLSQYNQIGNSVPPKLARLLGAMILSVLSGAHSDEIGQLELL